MYLCVFLLYSYHCGTLSADSVLWAGVRRGAGLPSGPSGGRRNSYFGWTVLEWDICESALNISPSWSVFIWFSSSLFFFVSLHAGPNWVATLNAGKGGAHASYYHRANKQVQQIPPCCAKTILLCLFYVRRVLKICVYVHQIQVGVEFEASTRTQETTTSFGYQMELPEANMVFRGKSLSVTCSVKTIKNMYSIWEIFLCVCIQVW